MIQYDGRIYSARTYDVQVPDLDSLTRLEALVWLNQNIQAGPFHEGCNTQSRRPDTDSSITGAFKK